MSSKQKYNSIFELIEKENDILLQKYYKEKPVLYIGFSKTRLNEEKITLKNLGTFTLLKNTFKIFLREGREYFRGGRKIQKYGNLSSGKPMTKELKEYYGYDLNKIDYKKMESLNKDELRFITDNLLNVAKGSLSLVENLHINFGGLSFNKKIKKIRNRVLIENRLLINTLIKKYHQDVQEGKINKAEYKEKYNHIMERQLVLKKDFQVWIIEKIRDEKVELPNIADLKTVDEMEINISKSIFKQL